MNYIPLNKQYKKYARGGFLNKTGQFLRNTGLGIADTALSSIGFNKVIGEDNYKGAGANVFNKATNAYGNISNIIKDTVLSGVGLSNVINDDSFEGANASKFADVSETAGKIGKVAVPIAAAILTAGAAAPAAGAAIGASGAGAAVGTTGAIGATTAGISAGSVATNLGLANIVQKGVSQLNPNDPTQVKEQQYQKQHNQALNKSNNSSINFDYNNIPTFALGGDMGTSNLPIVQEYKGNSHENGGIPVDRLGNPSIKSGKQAIAEVEGNEFKFMDYIFSDQLEYND